MTLVCVPVTRDEARTWARTGVLAGESLGFAATPAMLAAFELPGPDDEDTDLTLLGLASLASLEKAPRRLVAVAELPSVPDGDDLGRVDLDDVRWNRVTCLYTDDAAGRTAAAALHETVRAHGVERAWEEDAVQALLRDHALDWYGPSELLACLGD